MSIFAKSERKGPLSDRLKALNYEIEEAHVEGQLYIRIRPPSGRVWMTGKNMAYPMNSRFVHHIADNKQLSYELAQKLDIETPRSFYVTADNREESCAFLQRHPQVIVKPLDSYKSRGVTLDITTPEALTQAFEVAFEESPTAIIQEQVDGEEYRFTVLDDKVVSVLRRERPQVIGDGVSTVRQLVARENEQRHNLDLPGIEYPQWTKELLGGAVDSSEVLLADEVRILSGTTLVSRGASVYELIDDVDSSYNELATRFVRELGAGFVAIDMFIIDHAQSASRGNYWFNECNASPSLKMYLTPRNADSSHVIDSIVEVTDKYLNIT